MYFCGHTCEQDDEYYYYLVLIENYKIISPTSLSTLHLIFACVQASGEDNLNAKYILSKTVAFSPCRTH